jgi:prepilin-type N-terminal cleavage/methylation domain-containing protein
MSRTATRRSGPGGILANERGFTLVEFIIALGIVGLLSTTSVFSYAIYRDRARESNLNSMAHNFQVELLVHVNDFDLKHRWGTYLNNAYLNGYIERMWESNPYDNRLGHRNPASRSKVILCATSVPTSGLLTQPAVFITNTATYASKNMKATTVVAALKGSIVIYMNNNIKPVDLYYFDLAGRPSKLRVTINPSN